LQVYTVRPMYGIFQTLVFSVLLTTALYFLPNNSNLRKEYILPFIVALLTKYVLGDWDDGYIWSYSDVYYWGGCSYSKLHYNCRNEQVVLTLHNERMFL